jgi:hypothetical protein
MMHGLVRTTTGVAATAIALTMLMPVAHADTGSEPQIQYIYETTSDGYLIRDVLILVTDLDTLSDVACYQDDQRIWQYVQPGSSQWFFSVWFWTDGTHTLDCSATDVFGNTASQSDSFLVDATPPIMSTPTITQTLLRTDQSATVSVTASDAGSGLQEVSIRIDAFNGDETYFPMSPGPNNVFTYDVGPGLSAGQYGFSIGAVDRAGNGTSAQIPLGGLQVYDTSQSASAFGTFYPDAYSGDRLPGLEPFAGQVVDFRLSASYPTSTATHPTGQFSMRFKAGDFRARATSLTMLVPQFSRNWILRGPATVVDDDTPYTLVVDLVDAEWPNGVGNDFISIGLYPPGAPNESADQATYWAAGPLASGEVVLSG